MGVGHWKFPTAGLYMSARSGAAGHQRDMIQSGVAVKVLEEEPGDDGGRCQEGRIVPGVSGGAADGVDDVAVELGGKVLSQRVEGGGLAET